jgi:hypothetical protein
MEIILGENNLKKTFRGTAGFFGRPSRIIGKHVPERRLGSLHPETTFEDIIKVLTWHSRVLLDLPYHARAAVALILRTGSCGLEMLFIERALRADDPWSGDLGFPGGKVEAGERDPRLTAERETMEEIALISGDVVFSAAFPT